jgi:hypothetical protein
LEQVGTVVHNFRVAALLGMGWAYRLDSLVFRFSFLSSRVAYLLKRLREEVFKHKRTT